MMKTLKLLGLALIMSACCNHTYQRSSQELNDAMTSQAKFPLSVVVPEFRDATYDVLEFGADPSGRTLTTEALQAAIDKCNAEGGGTVLMPAGVYFTGPLMLKSNVRLYTEKNTFVLFSADHKLYPYFDTSFEGVDTKRCVSPLMAVDATNVAICGEGTFNGNGDLWRPVKKGKMTGAQWKKKVASGGVVENDIWYRDEDCVYAASLCKDQNVPEPENAEDWERIHSFLRPVMLHFLRCKNVLLEGVSFENSPAWNLHPMCCENLTLRNLTVRNPWYSQNGDGVDVESCKNVLIDHCSFDVGDDAICMKSGKNEDGRRRGIPCENVLVSKCVVYHGHGGFVVGSEMSGGVKNVQVDDCLFIGTDVGLRFKSTRGRGGVVENIFIQGVNMWGIPHEALLFDLFYGGKGAGEETEEELAARMNADAPAVDETTPAFKNIDIRDVVGTDVETALYFNGLPEMKIENVNLRNITMSAKKAGVIRQTNGLTIDNVEIVSPNELVIAPTVENVVRL